MTSRHTLLILALLATSMATYWAWRQPSESAVVANVKPAGPARPEVSLAPRAQAPGNVLQIRPRTGTLDAARDAFAVASWSDSAGSGSVKPAEVLAPALPPAPMAPPLPFKLLGRYVDEGQPLAVFLQFNDQNLVVREGDTIAEHYKVEGLDDKTLTLLHLPTQQRQTINIGTAP